MSKALLSLYIFLIRVSISRLFILLSLSLSLYSFFNYISLEILINSLIIPNYSFFYLKDNTIIGVLSLVI
jgi:hypothetical protein